MHCARVTSRDQETLSNHCSAAVLIRFIKISKLISATLTGTDCPQIGRRSRPN